jgi:hypothetical protein
METRNQKSEGMQDKSDWRGVRTLQDRQKTKESGGLAFRNILWYNMLRRNKIGIKIGRIEC